MIYMGVKHKQITILCGNALKFEGKNTHFEIFGGKTR